MKKIILPLLLLVVTANQLSAQQSKKLYVWVETESDHVFEYGTQNWKPQVPYKHFVRLISEVLEVPDENYLREQFYEYIMKNYASDLKKLRLHKSYSRMSMGYYDNGYGRAEKDYRALFEPVEKASWQFETILIEGFKYDPTKKIGGALYQKAEKLVVMGIE